MHPLDAPDLSETKSGIFDLAQLKLKIRGCKNHITAP